LIKTVLQKVLPVLIITYILSFLLLFCFYLIFPPAIVLPGIHMKYIFGVSLLSFIEYLIPITCSGLLIAYSLFLTEDDMLSKKGTSHPFHRAVTPMLFLLLVFSLIYAFLITWSYSLTLYSTNSILYNTKLVKNYMENAAELEKQGKYHEALALLEAGIHLDSSNKKIKELRDQIQNYLVEHEVLTQEEENEELLRTDGLTVADMVKKAQNFLYKEDWFSAYYYASLAYKIDPEQTGANDLARQAMQKITTYQYTIEDNAKRELFTKKQAGYNALLKENYLTAYYTFQELKKITPTDPDINIYLAVAQDKLKETSFFYEDCVFPLSLPGTGEILFLNSADTDDPDNKSKEFVTIKKMVHYNFEYYFQDIEVMELNSRGEVTLHFKAKYGKYYYADLPVKIKGTKSGSAHHILLDCISKDKQDLVFKPQYLVAAQGQTLTPGIYRIAPDPAWMRWLTLHPDKYRITGINELFEIKRYLPRFGYPEKEVNIEIMTRLTSPFLFLIFAVFSIAIGWLYRSRYTGRPPIGTILLIPLLPVIVGILYKLLFFLNRLFIIFSINIFGFIPALITGCVVLFALLLAAIFLIAGMVSSSIENV